MKIILLGPPGAGKGTQAEAICEKIWNPAHINWQYAQRSSRSGTALGLEAKSLMDSGILVSDEVIVGLVEERIGSSDCTQGFLFDGFPRTIPCSGLN